MCVCVYAITILKYFVPPPLLRVPISSFRCGKSRSFVRARFIKRVPYSIKRTLGRIYWPRVSRRTRGFRNHDAEHDRVDRCRRNRTGEALEPQRQSDDIESSDPLDHYRSRYSPRADTRWPPRLLAAMIVEIIAR